MKRDWVKPELVVLVRGRPEESVLHACKFGSIAGGAKGNKGSCMDQVTNSCPNLCIDLAVS